MAKHSLVQQASTHGYSWSAFNRVYVSFASLLGWQRMNPTLHKAANGHLSLDFNELSDTRWLSITEELVKLHVFKQVGSPVIGVSEKIHQSFQCATLHLAAGWDNWSGHYLLSDSVADDCFLQKFFDKALAGEAPQVIRPTG